MVVMNAYGDLVVQLDARPLVLLPRLWDFTSVSAGDNAAVLRSSNLGEVWVSISARPTLAVELQSCFLGVGDA